MDGNWTAEISEPLRLGTEGMRQDAAAWVIRQKSVLNSPNSGCSQPPPRSDFCGVWPDRVKCVSGLLTKEHLNDGIASRPRRLGTAAGAVPVGSGPSSLCSGRICLK